MLPRFEKYGLLLCTLNDLSFVQLRKAPLPIVFTDLPMEKLFQIFYRHKNNTFQWFLN